MANPKKLKVYTAPLPFSNKRVEAYCTVGDTVQGIVDQVCPPRLKKTAGVGAIVMINGEIVPRGRWKSVRPKEGTLINVRIVPTGGGGGKKNPLATILSIAIMVAAPYAAGAIGAASGGWIGATFFGQAFVTGLARVAIGVVGMMLTSALAPPPKQKGGGSVNNPAESPTQFIEGAQNSATPFGVVPINLGINRMVPLLAGRTFTETQGADQYARQLFCWGIGSALSLSDLKIGESSITDFTGYELSHRLAGDLNLGTSLYTTNPYQEDLNIALNNSGGYSQRQTQSGVDEVVIDFTFPQGLAQYNTKGKRLTESVEIEIGYATTAAPTSWTTISNIIVTAGQAEALRRSQRIVFPSRNTYLVRCKRVTADTSSTSIVDKVFWTSLKSFVYEAPVTMANCNGTAILIKGTDQLNGAVTQFNGIVSSIIPDYDSGTDTWITRVSNNPASLVRYVWQGCGNSKALADSKINLDDLAEWHTYCVTQGYTYNRVIDYAASVDDIVRDICAAGAASPTMVDGKRTVCVDKIKADIIQMVTPRNSWNYTGELIYPDLPHAFRVQFRNADKGYLQDEIMVYDDGYSERGEVAGTIAATVFEALELQSCTNAALAFKTGRRHIATVRLQPETHTFYMSVENLVSLRGDRIKLAHDVPIIGIGDGRVKSVVTGGGLVTGITLDDTITIPNASTYYVRIRLEDGSFLYKQISNGAGTIATLTFTTPFARPVTSDSPPANLLNIGDLLYVVEAGGEVDLIITSIIPQDDLKAKITALDYAPERFTAESSPIPVHQSHITTPLEFIRPLPPVYISAQSDESVMLKNSDGSYTSRAIFTLQNPNVGDVLTKVQVRISGSNVFTNANVLEATPERVILTGLQDGTYYDVHFRYKRVGGSMLSAPLELNSYLFVGASTTPSDVDNFEMAVVGAAALFTWDANEEIDIDHYVMHYSGLYSGATWETSQLVDDRIRDNRITLPFRGGTYMIKAVDILGNESEDATAIITFNADTLVNAVQVYEEAPTFLGTMDNVNLVGTSIALIDTTQVGYYYFANTLDLGAVFVSSLSASILASGTLVNNIFDMADVFGVSDIFGVGDNDIFDMPDIFDVDDVFGIGTDSWEIELQYRVTDGDTASSPVSWGAWTKFVAGDLSFRGIQFRLKLTSLVQYVSPLVSLLTVSVDMPDRIERGEDLAVDATIGLTVTYPNAFKASPSVAITIQNGATDDKIVFTSKTASGFTFKVYNQTLAAYVARTADYISSGYGREN